MKRLSTTFKLFVPTIYCRTNRHVYMVVYVHDWLVTTVGVAYE